jgi:RHS repeat-associated protein
LTASTSYDAYGNAETSGGLTSYTPFGFAGGYTDPTGLIYLVDRYYDSTTGQFLTVDPRVDQTGQPYAYTGDDPVNDVDPMGLDVYEDEGGGEVGPAGGGIIGAGGPGGGAYGGGGSGPLDVYGWTELNGASGVWLSPDGSISFTPPFEAAGAATDNLLADLASKAQANVGPGRGPVYGTAVHTEFEDLVQALGDSNVDTEVSYLNGEVVKGGRPGSVRLDVVEGGKKTPTAVYDLKTGSAKLTKARITQIRKNLPALYRNVPIKEVRP